MPANNAGTMARSRARPSGASASMKKQAGSARKTSQVSRLEKGTLLRPRLIVVSSQKPKINKAARFCGMRKAAAGNKAAPTASSSRIVVAA